MFRSGRSVPHATWRYVLLGQKAFACILGGRIRCIYNKNPPMRKREKDKTIVSSPDRSEARDNDNMQLPLNVSAFRLSMLQGSVPAQPKPRVPNSALNSQAVTTPPDTCVLLPAIDWLTLLWDTDSPNDCVNAIEEILEVNFDKLSVVVVAKPNGNWSTVRGTSGCQLSFKVVPAGDITVRLELPGSLSSSVGAGMWFRLWAYTSAQKNHRCTRIDYNVDDTTHTLGLTRIEMALREGNYAGYRSGEIYESVGGDRAGKTVYFGSPRSLQRVRFYDKKAESGGKIDAIRYEVQCRSARANEVYNSLIVLGEGELWMAIRGRLKTAISFISRTDKNLSRSRVVGFWEDFLALLDCASIVAPKLSRPSAISRTIDWAERTLPKAIMKIKEALGAAAFGDWLQVLDAKASYKVKESELSDILSWRAANDPIEYINGLKLRVELEISRITGVNYGGFDHIQTIHG
jgi:Replication initiation factor